jgi:FKBP-type peptidyl-prolyl cis-trans isomerase
MKPLVRSTAIAVATLLALSACKGENKPVEVSSSKTEADKAATDKTGYPGLPTEKEQISYTIGMAMGKQLAEIKDEVNVDTVVKALRTQMDGGKALINDEQAQQIMQAFSQKTGVVTTASGLQYQVLTEGKGAKPGATDGVKVNYKGTLLDGKEFDSSYKRGEPAVLPLQGVIPGWAEGLQLMPVGSKYKFWIPAKLAYGEQAPPMIGPNQVLEFEVELLEIVKAPSGK